MVPIASDLVVNMLTKKDGSIRYLVNLVVFLHLQTVKGR